MMKLLCLSVMALLALGLSTSAAAQDGKVYELRTYTTMPGKLPELLARFKNHTTAIFEKHGMKNVGYWVPTDPRLSENTLIYLLEHQSMEAAKKSWDGFRTDPAWLKARDESEVNGKLNQKVESVYLKATDFSKLQ